MVYIILGSQTLFSWEIGFILALIVMTTFVGLTEFKDEKKDFFFLIPTSPGFLFLLILSIIMDFFEKKNIDKDLYILISFIIFNSMGYFYFASLSLLNVFSWRYVMILWFIFIGIYAVSGFYGLKRERKAKNPLQGILGPLEDSSNLYHSSTLKHVHD